MGDPLGVYKMADLKVVTKGSKKPKRTLKADTVINVVIDMSGSMGCIADATMEGYNAYIDKQREEEGDVLVSLLLFDSIGWGENRETRLARPYTALPLEQVPVLTREVYRPSGGTPLRDAMGSNILETDDILSRVKTKNPDVFNVIITDGGENTSSRYTSVDIKEMVQGRENLGWSFVYMGANQNSWAETQQYGFQQGNVMNYVAADIKEGAFEKVAVATSYHRGMSRAMKSDGRLGVAESYTTSCFFDEAGVKEDEPAVSTTEGEES